MKVAHSSLQFDITELAVHFFTGMDRNGHNYRNGLPEWTIINVLEYFSFVFFKDRLA